MRARPSNPKEGGPPKGGGRLGGATRRRPPEVPRCACVRHARSWSHAVVPLPGQAALCASGTYGTREAGTRSPYVPYTGHGCSTCKGATVGGWRHGADSACAACSVCWSSKSLGAQWSSCVGEVWRPLLYSPEGQCEGASSRQLCGAPARHTARYGATALRRYGATAHSVCRAVPGRPLPHMLDAPRRADGPRPGPTAAAAPPRGHTARQCRVHREGSRAPSPTRLYRQTCGAP
eukprot:scaffold61217_cov74-Phaeocystis_antarctica.AAC.1